MFGIGATELLVILVLATILLGPEKMIEFAGQLGRWLAKIRAETDQITREFRDAFNLELGKDASGSSSSAGGRVTYNLPTSSEPAPAAAAPAVEPAAAASDTTPAVETAPATVVEVSEEAATLETSVEEEREVALDPDAAPIELEVGVLVLDGVDAEPLTLEGPVLVEDDEVVSEQAPLKASVEKDVEAVPENTPREEA